MAGKSDRPADALAKTREVEGRVLTHGMGVVDDAPGDGSSPFSLVGRMLSDRYKIERLIGEGGMGAVYQAEHTHMRKRMAIKVLHPEMSRLTEVVARFEREAMAAAHIDHPNVAAATDFGKLEDGSFFLALEFVEGKSLRDVVADGPMPVARALHVIRQIASGLGRAHGLGIVHRDLKPENVMLVEREGDPDFVKVLDFGIAKVPMGEAPQEGGPGGQILTRAGMVYGTPEYMAPEQALGQPVDKRADLYALGVMAFEMLTGKRPFDDDSKVKLLGMHVTAPVPPMSRVEPAVSIPPEIEQIVKNLLVKEATERTADAKELIDALQAAATSLHAQGKLGAEEAGRIAPPLVTPVASRPDASSGSAPGALGLATPLASAQMSVVGRGIGAKMMIAIAGAGVLVFAVLVGIALVRARKDPARAVLDAGRPVATLVSASSASGEPPVLELALTTEERILAAKRLKEKGDYASAIEQYNEVEAKEPGRADVNRGLFEAYVGAKKDVDAMHAAQRMFRADKDLADESALRIPVRDAALNTTGHDKEAADLAFGLLENATGAGGLADLYDIVYAPWAASYPEAQKRAQAIIWKPEARARMSAALLVTLDIRAAGGGCGVKQHLDRAMLSGDQRTLDALRAIRIGPKPVGFRRDPQACFRDDAVQRAIRVLEGKVAREKK